MSLMLFITLSVGEVYKRFLVVVHIAKQWSSLVFQVDKDRPSDRLNGALYVLKRKCMELGKFYQKYIRVILHIRLDSIR